MEIGWCSGQDGKFVDRQFVITPRQDRIQHVDFPLCRAKEQSMQQHAQVLPLIQTVVRNLGVVQRQDWFIGEADSCIPQEGSNRQRNKHRILFED